MISIHEVALTSAYMTIYKDADDKSLFYYVPQFSELSKDYNGNLNFGAAYYTGYPNDPSDDFIIVNFGVRGVTPNEEFRKALEELKQTYGETASLQPINPSVNAPKLRSQTPLSCSEINCQSVGSNLYTDLVCSFRLPGQYGINMKNDLTTGIGWSGAIEWRTRAVQPEFEWSISLNWKRVQTHFKSQASIKYWFIKSNISYEVKKLMENGTVKITTRGGNVTQRDEIRKLAEQIAKRLFVASLQPTPFPSHPSGAALCLSINYSRVEEDRVESWHGRDEAYIDHSMGLAVYVKNVPERLFTGFDSKNLIYQGNGDELSQQAIEQINKQ